MTWEIAVGLLGIFLAGDGVIKYLIQKRFERQDKIPEIMAEINEINGKMDNLTEAVMISLDAHKVELKALHDGHLNGEGDTMLRTLDQFEHGLVKEGLGGYQSEAR